jgi:hypothetical protein
MSSDSRPGRLQLFGLALLAGVLMIAASLMNRVSEPGPALRVALAILPVLPLAALAWAIMRAIASLDELQRRIQLDAMSAVFVGGIFVAVIYGQLQHAHVGLPDLNWAYFYPVQLVLWAIGYLIASRRYQ